MKDYFSKVLLINGFVSGTLYSLCDIFGRNYHNIIDIFFYVVLSLVLTKTFEETREFISATCKMMVGIFLVGATTIVLLTLLFQVQELHMTNTISSIIMNYVKTLCTVFIYKNFLINKK